MTELQEGYKIVKDEYIRQTMIDFLMARREVLCQELAFIERRLEEMGKPVKKPRME